MDLDYAHKKNRIWSLYVCMGKNPENELHL